MWHRITERPDGSGEKALHYGVALSFAIGVVMFYISFYHGIVLAGIFSSDPVVATAGADYLKAYAIDCLLTAIFFCYVGFYNGIGLTKIKSLGVTSVAPFFFTKRLQLSTVGLC